MRVLSIIGTRPQLIRIPLLNTSLQKLGFSHEILNTSQHYDMEMSSIFIEEFGIKNLHSLPKPSSKSSLIRFAEMLTQIEIYFQNEREQYDAVIVYGDTDSTLAGALWAKRKGFLVVHVEAGLRSGNQQMPEELNRILVDHVSDLHLAPSQLAVQNLTREGLSESVRLVGDILMDHLKEYKFSDSNTHEELFRKYEVTSSSKFFVVSFHRHETVNSREKLEEIVSNVNMATELTFVLGHPKLLDSLRRFDLKFEGKAHVIIPLGHSELIDLIYQSSGVMTDSGGLQRESTLLGVPTLIARKETEWLELLNYKNTVLKGDTRDWELALNDLPRLHHDLSNLGSAAQASSEAIYNFLNRVDK